ncbi:GT2 family glycosyltransferase [Paraburkholderia sp. GAS199]|uniref:glycosyltransferase family 2 protein n=1 Tax=Paraburkholderia sp. GAS199 TaxID=3035126 RepID=UPI003D1CC2F0
MDVLTLVHGRADHLTNLITGLERSLILPEHLVIVQMNQAVHPWHSDSFPIINVSVQTTDDALPLARARNLAVASSVAAQLVFLDVDCIPSRSLLSSYQEGLAQNANSLLQGRVQYLPATDLRDWDEAHLDRIGQIHPVFVDRAAGFVLPHELFWSLNFACSRVTFTSIEGFDEAYIGYGGEDTDFSFRAQAKGIDIRLVDAKAFHQHHTSHNPPINHLAAIVRNAQTFRDRWGMWPMQGWLDAFEAAGFISIKANLITIVKMPTAVEIGSTRQ